MVSDSKLLIAILREFLASTNIHKKMMNEVVRISVKSIGHLRLLFIVAKISKFRPASGYLGTGALRSLQV